jgi:eukaryotic-like serine/threonine-protein kinase
LQWCRHAEASVLDAAARHSERVAANDTACAALLVTKGATDEALRLARNARAIRVALFGASHPLVASSDILIGFVYAQLDRGAKALPYFDRARAVFEETLGPEHPMVATAYANTAAVNLRLGRYADGRPQAERALQIRERVLPADHPDLATAFNTMGWVYLETDDRVRAVESFRRALAIRERTLGPDHPDLASALGNLGIALRAQGACVEAVEVAARALAIVQAASGDGTDVLFAQLNVADGRLECGKPHEALADFASAMAAAAGGGSGNLRVRIRALRGFGEASLALGSVAQARAPLERALELALPVEDDPQGLAKNLFLLARALADDPRERERALALASAAHFLALATGARGRASVEEIERWLSTRSL